MTDREIEVLTARVESLERAFVVLAGFLQEQKVLDTQRLQAALRIHAERLQERPEVVRCLDHLADQVLREYLLQAGQSPEEVERRLRFDGD